MVNIKNKKNRKNGSIISIISMLSIFIIFGLSKSNPDMQNYIQVFDYLKEYNTFFYPYMESGFTIIMRLFSIIGLDYNSMIFCIALLYCTYLYRFINKYSNYPIVVLCLYVFFPFFLDVVQIRNSIAMLLLLYGLEYLSEKKYIKYIIIIFIAALFHNTSIFYLSFLLVSVKNRNNLVKIIVFIGSFIYIFKGTIMQVIVKFLPLGEKYIRYLDGTKNTTVVLFFLFFITNIIIMEMLISGIEKYNYEYSYLTNNQITLLDTVSKINIIILLTFIFVSIDVDFYRIYRNIMIVNYITFSNSFYKGRTLLFPKLNLSQIIFIIFNISTGVAFLYYNQFNHVVMQILRSISL